MHFGPKCIALWSLWLRNELQLKTCSKILIMWENYNNHECYSKSILNAMVCTNFTEKTRFQIILLLTQLWNMKKLHSSPQLPFFLVFDAVSENSSLRNFPDNCEGGEGAKVTRVLECPISLLLISDRCFYFCPHENNWIQITVSWSIPMEYNKLWNSLNLRSLFVENAA